MMALQLATRKSQSIRSLRIATHKATLLAFRNRGAWSNIWIWCTATPQENACSKLCSNRSHLWLGNQSDTILEFIATAVRINFKPDKDCATRQVIVRLTSRVYAVSNIPIMWSRLKVAFAVILSKESVAIRAISTLAPKVGRWTQNKQKRQ